MIEYKIRQIGNSDNIFLIRENKRNYNIENYINVEKSMLNLKLNEIDDLITFLQNYKNANQN